MIVAIWESSHSSASSPDKEHIGQFKLHPIHLALQSHAVFDCLFLVREESRINQG